MIRRPTNPEGQTPDAEPEPIGTDGRGLGRPRMTDDMDDFGELARSEASLFERGLRDGWISPYRIAPETRRKMVEALEAMLARGIATGKDRVVVRATMALQRLDAQNLEMAATAAKIESDRTAAKRPQAEQTVVIQFDGDG